MFQNFNAKAYFLLISLFVVGPIVALGSEAYAESVIYYHTDLVGSPIAQSDSEGNIVWQESYMPYGYKLENAGESLDNEMWYTGKPHDADTGLTYMNARYYDPLIGRFMAPDPVSFVETVPGSFNRYSYANNNPYLYNDPDGEFINNVVGGLWAGAQNIAIQQIEISLGVREEFSYAELGADVALGAVTSGLSAAKNAGRLGVLGSKVGGSTKSSISNVKWAGSGPTAGVLGVNASSSSVKAIQNYYPKDGGIEFVFNHKTNTFVVGEPKSANYSGSAHQKLAQTINGDVTNIVGGTFSRGKNGEILTDENSGHYGEFWNPEIRQQFMDAMRDYGLDVHHSDTY